MAGRTSITTRLNIVGFQCSPSEITDALGVAPSVTWRLGEPRIHRVGPPLNDCNGWRLVTNCDPLSTTIDEQIFNIMERLGEGGRRLSALPEGADVEISIIIYVYDDRSPYVGLSVESVSLVASIGASLDFDIYHMRETP